jgi:hypothetical protein
MLAYVEWLETTGSELNGEFDLEYFGPVAFIQVTFQAAHCRLYP